MPVVLGGEAYLETAVLTGLTPALPWEWSPWGREHLARPEPVFALSDGAEASAPKIPGAVVLRTLLRNNGREKSARKPKRCCW